MASVSKNFWGHKQCMLATTDENNFWGKALGMVQRKAQKHKEQQQPKTL